MGRINRGGHIRALGGDTEYRLIRHMDDGVSKQVLEHRYVMEKHLGRKLSPSEIVHHKDGNGLNNEISNLEIMSQREHRIKHSGPFKWSLEEALELKDKGYNVTDIGRTLGVSQSSISQAFKRRGIDTRTSRVGKNRKFDWDEAERLYDCGERIADIAMKFGVCRGAIKSAIRNNKKERGIKASASLPLP